MKKNLLRVFCLVLVLTMLVGVLPALAANDISVFVSVSAQGAPALTKDGKPAVLMEVRVPEGATVEDAIIAAHKAYCPDGAEGWEKAESDWGMSMVKIWGSYDGVGAYYVNGEMPMVQSWEMQAGDGDYVDLILYGPDWSDSYACFDQRTAIIAAGEKLTLTLTRDEFDENWVAQPVPLAGAAVKTTDGKVLGTTDKDGKITVSFAEAGTYLITASSEDFVITAPLCAAYVGPAMVIAPAKDISVFVSVSAQGVPALTKDGKPASALKVTVPAGSTVEDAIIAAHKAYCPAGAEGWEKAESDWGMSMVKIWGSYDGVGAYYVNGVMPWVQSWEMEAHDYDSVDLVLYGPDWSDSYACFDQRAADAEAGKKLTLTLTHDEFDENWVAQPVPLAGATVKTTDGKVLGTTDKDGKVTVSFAAAGLYYVTASSADAVITAPICVVSVAAPASAYKTYVVKAGDTLWSIAKSQLGDAFRWGELFDANYDLIKNPRMIYVGQVLNIPA